MAIAIAYIFSLFFKSVVLLLLMAVGAIFAVYGGALRFVLGLEAHPSTVRRFAWMAWGMVIAGLLLFIYAVNVLVQLILA